MRRAWNILIVDDEPDIHEVTALALRRRQWQQRSFELVSAHSAAQARELLLKEDGARFHVCIVDVVMESDSAGLELCQFIRERLPLNVRIILRTGQPGVAPEEKVLNDYDIDQYLAKAEVNGERLYAAVRTSLRSSLDVALLLALGKQLKGLTDALQRPTTTAVDLLAAMREGFEILDEKYDARVGFIPDLEDFATGLGLEEVPTDRRKLHEALSAGRARGVQDLQSGAQFGLPDSLYLLPMQSFEPARKNPQGSSGGAGLGRRVQRFFGSLVRADAARARAVHGGFVVASKGDGLTSKDLRDLSRELSLFADNWRVAFAMLTLQDSVVSERVVNISGTEKYGVPI